jgi:hypothetical protein
MARKLSPAMETHLLNLRAGRVYGGWFDSTYQALERRGYARFKATLSRIDLGHWYITLDGVKAARRLVEEKD